MWRTALLLAALCVLYSSRYGRSQGRLQSYQQYRQLHSAARWLGLRASYGSYCRTSSNITYVAVII